MAKEVLTLYIHTLLHDVVTESNQIEKSLSNLWHLCSTDPQPNS